MVFNMDNSLPLLNQTPIEPSEVKDDNKKLDPVEAAAYFLNQAHQGFNRLTYGLSKRKKHALGRVLQAVLFEPLEPVPLFGKAEEELFAICQEVMRNKGIIMNDAIERFKKQEGVTNTPSQTQENKNGK